jgi:hypothetical protein
MILSGSNNQLILLRIAPTSKQVLRCFTINSFAKKYTKRLNQKSSPLICPPKLTSNRWFESRILDLLSF